MDTSATRAADKYQREEELDDGGDGSADDFLCTFCGMGDKSWTEDVLDLHYLKDCPLLAPCPACAQVSKDSLGWMLCLHVNVVIPRSLYHLNVTVHF